ncbi:MAG TPA: Stk1 family PASTA domain-containing Ser/Thr kinase [Gaiellaceae bacterium]|nr:Stk1 family PASTA domain-containing Ser/Thr kinase [Gaiellaceae bacterium]
MAVSDTLIDTLFDGRYRILKRIGSGGMADVYLAEDEVLGRRVAIKILNERHAGDEQFIERFRREAQSAASLSHPNVVAIYDRGEAEGTYYIAMELLDGRNIKELIVARGPAPPRIVVEYTRQILAALAYSHRHSIVHRDIKPHNVVVDADGRVKVTDFGIARGGSSQMTEVGSIVGTAQYLSPEQARGEPVDARSDLYSLGVVMYELLTGTVPFTGDSPVEIAMKHLSATPQPPSERREGMPEELDLVVMRALAKNPTERYQSAEEMDADLERIQRGLGVSPRTAEAATAVIAAPSAMPTMVSRAPTEVKPAAGATPPPVYYDYEEPPRRRPIWPWLLPILLLLATLGIGLVVYQQIQDQLDDTKPIAVPNVEGLRETLAVNQLESRDIQYEIVEEPSTEQPKGFVFDQDPEGGKRIDRATDVVRLHVSTGPPTTEVPDVRGRSRDDAVAALTDAKLEPNVVKVNSEKPVDTVIAQSPKPGETVEEGTAVRINVSAGPKPVAVPSVLGQPFESATATLQAAGFAVARRDADSNQPGGTVIDQSPAGGSTAAKGATITLTVSKGPTTAAVPDVTSLDRDTAVQTLRDSGFKASVTQEDTTDPSLDGVVLSQDPGGGAQAEPGATVTIAVGRYVEPADTSLPPGQGGAPPGQGGTIPGDG